MPPAAIAIDAVLPLKHLLDGMKDVMVRGLGPSPALGDLGVLLALALVASRVVRFGEG
jgi:hypothetical protein